MTTIDLYGEHFGDESDNQSEKQSFKEEDTESLKYVHHIANNSESDEYFLEDDEDEVFSSLCPPSVKGKKEEQVVDTPWEQDKSYHSRVIKKLFKSLSPKVMGSTVQDNKPKYKIQPDSSLPDSIELPQSNKEKSLTELEEYVFNVIHSRKDRNINTDLDKLWE